MPSGCRHKIECSLFLEVELTQTPVSQRLAAAITFYGEWQPMAASAWPAVLEDLHRNPPRGKLRRYSTLLRTLLPSVSFASQTNAEQSHTPETRFCSTLLGSITCAMKTDAPYYSGLSNALMAIPSPLAGTDWCRLMLPMTLWQCAFTPGGVVARHLTFIDVGPQ